MKINHKQSKIKGFLVGILVFALTLGLGVGVKAFWDRIADGKDNNVNIGDRILLSVNQNKSIATGNVDGKLIPSDAIFKVDGDITEYVATYEIKVVNDKKVKLKLDINVNSDNDLWNNKMVIREVTLIPKINKDQTQTLNNEEVRTGFSDVFNVEINDTITYTLTIKVRLSTVDELKLILGNGELTESIYNEHAELIKGKKLEYSINATLEK